MAEIHPTAVIHPTAELADDVKVGPFCVIGPRVKLGKGCVLHSHVFLDGPSTFGEGNEFFPFATIGTKTQDLKYKEEPTFLEVGNFNVFREYSNINRSTFPETKTVIGSYNNFLIHSHCGHECEVGDYNIFSGYAAAAGHCQIGNWVIVSGCAALHQFVRVGDHAMVGGCARITQDVAPYMIAEGSPASIRAVNQVGLSRRGYSEDDIKALRFVYKKLFLKKGTNTQDAIETILADEKYGSNACAKHLIDFISKTERGFIH